MDKRCKCRSSHDITFCVAKACMASDMCHRYFKNHQFGKNDLISMCDFWEKDKKCKDFALKEDYYTDKELKALEFLKQKPKKVR